MIPSRSTRAVLATAVLTVVLAGCGGGEGEGDEAEPAQTPATAPAAQDDGGAFVEQADALCTDVNAGIRALFMDLQGPPEPEVFGELATIGRQFVEDFRALEVPEGDAAVIDDVLATYDEALDRFEEASVATDPQAGMAAVGEAETLVQEADAALAEYGIEACQATSGAGG